MRYHLFPFLIPKSGSCFEIRTTFDTEAKYFKAEQAWENMMTVLAQPWYRRLFYQPWLSWEIVADGENISYRLWVPNGKIGRQLIAKYQAEFPETEFVPVQSESLSFDQPHMGTKLKLKRHWSLPFKTFTDDAVDTQAELVGILEGLEPGQKVVIQFLARPLTNRGHIFKKVLDQLDRENGGSAEESGDQIYYEAISTKRTRGIAHVNVKAIAFGETKAESADMMASIRKSFGTFTQNQLNSFYGREWWQIIRPVFRYEFRHRILSMELSRRETFLSTREMSLLMRTPSRKVGSNRLNRMKMRRTPLPKEVKDLTRNPAGDPVHIGEHVYHGVTSPVVFDLKGLNRHMAIWGGTSMGKSTFLYNFLQDFAKTRTDENRSGFTVIDPHGSLAQDVVSRIPKEQQHLIRYVRFADGDFPFNVYDVDFQVSVDKVAQNMTDVCQRVWKDFWGPNIDDNFFNAGMALQKAGKASIPNVQRMLVDFRFGMEVIQQLSEEDPLERQLKLYFHHLYDLKDREYQLKTNSTLNKLRKVTLSETLNRLLSPHTNGIRWREGMDQGYFHIFDLSGLTAFEKQFIGSLCLTFSQLAALSREDLYQSGTSMPLHPIVVDEAPTFMSHSADAIQSFADEARKYNVPLILGMQGMEGQVPDQVASAIFRNFGNMVAYRVGNERDRENIYQNLKVDYLAADDFKEMDANYAYVRMAIGRETTRPFLVLMKPPGEAPFQEDILELKQAAVRRAQEIEEEAVERFAIHAEQEKVETAERVEAVLGDQVAMDDPRERLKSAKMVNSQAKESTERDEVKAEDVFLS